MITNTKINELLSDLNDEQKKCVDVENLDGKFLVLAGPGTGKTHTVIRRLQAMILQGVKPERILCMTYSRAGADEMKKRVLKELDERNNNIEIHTFHGFCNKIITEYAEEFNLPAHIGLIPDGMQSVLVKECIDEITDAKYYKSSKADKYSCLSSILDGIKELKRYRITDKNGITLEENIQSDHEWQRAINDLIKERDFNPKPNKKYADRIQDIEDKKEKVRELYKFFLLYKEKMELGGYIDYDDMINYILEKFEDDPAFAMKISNQYDYIIIDEYQDTNRMQNELIFHLIDNSEKGNIFVVGDDKQIVNASQGARIDSMKLFSQKYNIGEDDIIKFTENYRSTQIILNVAEHIAKRNTELLIKDVHLDAFSDEKKNSTEKVRLNVYKDWEQEANDIIKEIDTLVKSEKCPIDKNTGEKDYSQIAILSTNKDDLAYYAELLHNKDIPYELKNGKNIFEVKSTIYLYYYLQALVNPDANSDKIFRLLLLPPFNISPKSFAMLHEENSRHKNFIDAMRAILNNDKAPSDITDFLKIYDELKTKVLSGETVYRVVLQSASKTGIFDTFTTKEENQLENTLALQRLFQEAYDYSGQYQKVNLEDFVDYLDMLQKDKKPLCINKEEIKMNAVQLTTYQSAKGLEYEYVYMPSLQESKWKPGVKPYIKPSVPLSRLDEKDDPTWDSYKQADKVNKMYVGMTRAKSVLRLSYFAGSGDQTCAQWLQPREISEEYLTIDDSFCKETAEKKKYKWAAALTIKDFNYKEEYKSHIDAVLKKKEYYSPSFVNPYIKCPRRFFLDTILGLNSPNFAIPDSLNFGKAVHKACENAVKYARENEHFYDSDTFVQDVKKQIDEYPFSSFKQREQYKTIAETDVKEFYAKDLSLTDIDTIYNVEKDIITDFEGVKFKGLPDRINLVDGKFKIYDYKTGKAKGAKEICLTNPDDEDIGLFEEYYIQLGLYKYFLEKTEGKTVSETTFLFPQNYKKPYTVDYDEDAINKVLDKYRNAIKGIQNHDFEPNPSKVSCQYCPFKNDLCEVRRVEAE